MPFLSAPELAGWLRSLYGGLPEGIIFDCDGVLIDSKDANIAYYNYLRQHLGLPPIPKEQEAFAQAATVQEVLDVIIPKPLRPFVRDASRKISYLKDIMPHVTHYPGLHGVLDFCRERGVKMGMDTNRVDGMDIILDNCRLHGYFDPIVLADSVSRPKPDPEGALAIAEQWGCRPERLLFVGDSSTDKGAAEGAGMPFLSFKSESLAPQAVEDFATLQESLRFIGL